MGMRFAFGLLSVFMTAACPGGAALPPDLPPASPMPMTGHAVQREAEIPLAEPVPDEAPIPNAEPIPGETLPPAQQARNLPSIPPAVFSPNPVPQHETRVAVLGYHDFSRTLPATEMRIHTDTFRAQMLALKQNHVPVISMKEFLEWKLGSRQLPANCVMITIDDGWKSVYTDAYPILLETGFPFTIFPYTKFITGLGSSMSQEHIQEMLNNGATLGSHSVSHLYPKSWRAALRKGQQAALDLAAQEIGGSRTILQEKFPGSTVEAYCYPGGFVLPDMITKAEEAGFKAAFTVIPKKVTKDTDRWRIHRYIIFGKNPRTFASALDFRAPVSPETPEAGAASGGAAMDSYPAPAQPVTPAANTIVHETAPDISISLAREADFNPKTLEMRVSGFGQVNAGYDAQEKTLKWKPSRHLRLSPVTVQVRWRTASTNAWQTATWQFGVKEKETHFIPQNIVK